MLPFESVEGRWFKGVPAAFADAPIAKLRNTGLSLLDDALMLPAAVLRRSALERNRAWMRAFTAHFGLDLAPHGKTTMSPELIRQQLADGAWGITAATAQHVRAYAAIGVPRILLANQLVGRANIDAVLGLLAEAPDLDCYCLVDSVAGVAMLAEAVAGRGLSRPLKLLVELGAAGQRAGVRTLDEALAVARACAARPGLVALAGVEAFEGLFVDPEPARALLARLAEAVRAFDDVGYFAAADEVIVSAGGSLFFDIAARAMLTASASRPPRLVLRSGCYLTHDTGFYGPAFDAMLAREPALAALERLEPALEVWAHVQSRPEPTRVIASLGKRDISHDIHPPVAQWMARPGRDAAPVALAGAARVASLYDQHICLDVPADLDLAVGDLIGFGLSHPCTTFDKWRALFVVDDDYRVVDVVTTLF